VKITQPLTVYLPDTRGVVISRFGFGNLKIGPNVFTYSRLPGRSDRAALGGQSLVRGTCPGATTECQAICYASRPVQEGGPVFAMWEQNSISDTAPRELPPDCRLLRIHVSGDFTSEGYIDGWCRLLAAHPDVTAWAYTRSWRVPSLLPTLERLRALPNVQLFALMDVSTPELPPAGWRRAWIFGDPRADVEPVGAVSAEGHANNYRTADGAHTYVCPEETGRKPHCETCGYCFGGQQHDVTFLRH